MSINWFTPLYILALYGLVRFFVRSKEGDKKEQVNWSPLESAGVTLFIFFAAEIIGLLLLYVIPLLMGWKTSHINDWLDNSVLGQFLATVAIEGVTAWLLLNFLKRRLASVKTIGLNRWPIWKDLGYVLLGFAAYFVSYIIIIDIVKAVVPSINLNQQQQIGFQNPAHWQLPLVFISLVILPPLVEELLVRGFLYSGLKKGLPQIWAVLTTSGLFAIAHLQAGSGAPLLWVAAIDTFILSLVLIFLKERTGSLWASIGLHMLKNGVAFISLFILHVV